MDATLQRNEKQLFRCEQVTQWFEYWTGSLENFNSDLRVVPGKLRLLTKSNPENTLIILLVSFQTYIDTYLPSLSLRCFESHFKGVFIPALFGSKTKPKKSLVRTFWAGLNANHRTRVRTKQPVRDPAGEAVSVRFQTNPGAVRLRCDCDRARSTKF